MPERLRPLMSPCFSWQVGYQQSCLLELCQLHPICRGRPPKCWSISKWSAKFSQRLGFILPYCICSCLAPETVLLCRPYSSRIFGSPPVDVLSQVKYPCEQVTSTGSLFALWPSWSQKRKYQCSQCPEQLRPLMPPLFSWQLCYQQSWLLELSLLHPICRGWPRKYCSIGQWSAKFFQRVAFIPSWLTGYGRWHWPPDRHQLVYC